MKSFAAVVSDVAPALNVMFPALENVTIDVVLMFKTFPVTIPIPVATMVSIVPVPVIVNDVPGGVIDDAFATVPPAPLSRKLVVSSV